MFSFSLWFKSNRHYILGMGFKNMNYSHIDLKTFPDFQYSSFFWFGLCAVPAGYFRSVFPDFKVSDADKLHPSYLQSRWPHHAILSQRQLCLTPCYRKKCLLPLSVFCRFFFWNSFQIVMSSSLLIIFFLGVFPLPKGYKIIFIWSSFSRIKHIEGTERTCLFQMMK